MWRRIGCITVLTLGSFALIAALTVSWMSRMAPSWYAPPDANSVSVATVADDFEYDVVERVQRHRSPRDSDWSASISEQQINAWLANRLPKWIAHDSELRWPASLGMPQVKIEPNGISVAVPVGQNTPRTVVARFLPTLKDGKMYLRVDHVAVGRISMPGEPLANLVKAIDDVSPETLNDPSLKQAIGLLSGEQAIEPSLQLEDGRRIRVTRLQLSFRKIDVSAVTESRSAQ
jgi:hypothetical protein